MKRLATLSALALSGYWMWKSHTGPQTRRCWKAEGVLNSRTGSRRSLVQAKAGLQAMNLYLDGFHRYSDDEGHQIEAHHYCAQVNEDLLLCVIFDENMRDARLMLMGGASQRPRQLAGMAEDRTQQ